MNKKQDIEIRNLGNIELKDSESRNVEGYAAVFDSESQDLGFIEKIERSAITEDLIKSCDIFALFNHEDDKVLARSRKGKGSLKLSLNERGLYYNFNAPKNDLGNTLLEYLERGDIFGSSFAFSVDWNDPEAQTWEKRGGKTYRTIKKISRLYDISPVFEPAYLKTNVSQRALDKIEELDKEEKMQEELRKNEIFNKLDSILKEIDDENEKYLTK